MKLSRVICWTLVAALEFGSGLLAQSVTASLSGTVLDVQQGAVKGARLTLRDPARGLTREAVSDSTGAYQFAHLPPSAYELAVEAAGFAAARFSQIILNTSD